MKADLALINANIRTMNPLQPFAQAVAIKKNRILKVGTNQEIRTLIGKDTKVINLDGKTVVPGLIDTHIHLADFGRCLMWLDLSGVRLHQDASMSSKRESKANSGWKMDCRSRLERE